MAITMVGLEPIVALPISSQTAAQGQSFLGCRETLVGDRAITAQSDYRPLPAAVTRRAWLAGAGGLAIAAGLGGYFIGQSWKTPARPQGCADAPRTGDEHALCAADIAFSRQGVGSPVVLLHGLGASRRAWQPIVDDLAKNHSVLLPDLPGFGFSPALAIEPNVSNLADAVAAWMRDAGLERPHIVGNSLGGAIALELGRRGAARSVIALSPIGFWSDVERAYSYSVVASTFAVIRTIPMFAQTMAKREEVRFLLFGFFFAQSDRLFVEYASAVVQDIQRAQAMQETLNACNSYRVPPYRNAAPTTLAWGAHDRLLIGPQDQRARTVMPAAKHVMLPGCGHVCMADDPDLVVATVEATIAAAG